MKAMTRIVAPVLASLFVWMAVPAGPEGDRVARTFRGLADSGTALARDPSTGYLRPLLEALRIPVESQILVFSKTGVQHAFTGPRTPRALYFDESIVIGYVPGAPAIEIIAHDPVEGLAFYTLDQTPASAPVPVRRNSCLTCHESSSTQNVPGLIVRSHVVDADGTVLPPIGALVSHDVDQRTSHPDRWGGWLVTSEGVAAPYNQRAHQGNITFTPQGQTSSQVFIEWMDSAPEARGYLSASSDVVALLAFDHQMPAINLMNRLRFHWRRVTGEGRGGASDAETLRQIDALADYLLFTGEASLPVALAPRPGFAAALAARIPKDRNGRSFAQLDAQTRLLRYPCSYMIYSDAFESLPVEIRQGIYRRMIEKLSTARTDDRLAILEILRDTKPDFPRE